jgi:hypothetical protein
MELTDTFVSIDLPALRPDPVLNFYSYACDKLSMHNTPELLATLEACDADPISHGPSDARP